MAKTRRIADRAHRGQLFAGARGPPRPADPGPPSGEFDTAVERRPAGGEHWGPIARTLGRLGDPRGLPTLVEAYHEVYGDQARRCCGEAIRSAIFTIVTAP